MKVIRRLRCILRGLCFAGAVAALEELDELLQAEGDDEADADRDEVNEHDKSQR